MVLAEELRAARAEGPRIVEHEKERRHREVMFASSPLTSERAGRGHRRGLDGPTMPKTILKSLSGVCPNRRAVVGVEVVGGLTHGVPTRRGHSRRVIEFRARPARAARI